MRLHGSYSTAVRISVLCAALVPWYVCDVVLGVLHPLKKHAPPHASWAWHHAAAIRYVETHHQKLFYVYNKTCVFIPCVRYINSNIN